MNQIMHEVVWSIDLCVTEREHNKKDAGVAHTDKIGIQKVTIPLS